MSTPMERERLMELLAAEQLGAVRQLARELGSLGVPHLVLSTAGEWLRPFAAFMARERRRR